MICALKSRPSNRMRFRSVRTFTIPCSSMWRPPYGTTSIRASSALRCTYSTYSICPLCRSVSAAAAPPQRAVRAAAEAAAVAAATMAALPVPVLCRRQLPSSCWSQQAQAAVGRFLRVSSSICRWTAGLRCQLELVVPAVAFTDHQRQLAPVAPSVPQTHCHAALHYPHCMRIRCCRYAMISRRCRWRAVVASISIYLCVSRATFW